MTPGFALHNTVQEYKSVPYNGRKTFADEAQICLKWGKCWHPLGVHRQVSGEACTSAFYCALLLQAGMVKMGRT
jgi:hypothetical protein